MKIRVGLLSLLGAACLGAAPIGIIGGGDQLNPTLFPPYAALVDADGTPIPISGFPSTGFIYSVAMNSSSTSLIGAQIGSAPNPYAAFVASDGTLTELLTASDPNFPSIGFLSTVALNNSKNGLIGGVNRDVGFFAYAAFVNPDGTLTNIPLSLGDGSQVNRVAINNSGVGIIGGTNIISSTPYAAYAASPSSPFAGLPVTGEIDSVAINDAGVGLVGGADYSPFRAFAAFVRNGVLTDFSLTEQDIIQNVAINTSGSGLVAGTNFAYSVDAGGHATSISGISVDEILSLALNDAGVGLIGGDVNDQLYAAFIRNGQAAVISGLPTATHSTIRSVALNNEGVGLLGGYLNNNAYAALVAPNGAVTAIGGLPLSMRIISADLARPILNAVTPQSVGPYSSVSNAQFAAMNTLGTHITMKSRFWSSGAGEENGELGMLLVDAKDRMLTSSEGSSCCFEEPKCALWMAPFGNHTHLKADGVIPAMTNDIAGLIAAFDYQFSHFLLGGGLGYGYNYIHYSQSLGHGKLQEEMGFLYGMYKGDRAWLDLSIWGGGYQLNNERHAPFSITATAKIHGWILAPHLQLAVPFDIGDCSRITLEPFASFDWVNNWQNSFTEKGASGLNISMDDQYNSLLRSELGLRFYQMFSREWGRVLLEEKLSYINQAPFNVKPANVAFVGSAAGFPIATGSSKMQNLGGANFRAAFVPEIAAYPYGSIDGEVELGTSYQSYLVSFEIGKRF